ncbi:two-component system response regulator YesN [Hydrogenoanaerobacterium saccharovorans]|uniref:Stage 0 sporulation protein A homolog n=1 Tax=Hydrogenoanaerobacterium saccharovorans TaxID=474960 RepID=A0A1H8DTN1_9FIRM|nr:response regulator [Hydrogenoanaerobacterium saccharovorans]RPF42384.1 two-component system response regulator YesN [Hydrogenoanaerobacterium saccharovorans]SEN10535.1 two-component system, response regulator YesN [Hydrogenoanaerobacterium saccharovorans]
MYKVLIVDDESIIVEGLTRIVPWERYCCEVVGSANDGVEGTLAIRKQKPDILFTDIRMPGKDGLGMLAGIKSEFPDMQVTVLTGFRDFSYAQEAIKLGVTRFLLKPSKMDELEEALDAMTSNLHSLLHNSRQTAVQAPTNHSEVASSFIVRQAVSYIEEHCSEKISLCDVADKCYVSQWHLSKLLGKYTNQSFYDILNGARIAKAKELLYNPALRISDISEMVGYIDTAHFSRVFKKSEGISANEYRNLKTD